MSQRTVPACEFWFDASRQQMNNPQGIPKQFLGINRVLDFNFPIANPDGLGYMNNGMGHNFISSHTGPSEIAEEAARRREIRLLKNREAARECRRKKKEYVKCLENRVQVLEGNFLRQDTAYQSFFQEQNRSLIEELQNLKEIHSNSTRSLPRPVKAEAP